MKRCPQCEFIYEDDQSHCDMDGARLRRDARPLPGLQSVALPAEVDRPKWRSRIVTATAATILAGVLGLVYYVSTHQASRGATNIPMPAAAEAPADNGVAAASATTEGEAPKQPEVKQQQELQSVNAIPTDGDSSASLSHDAKSEEKPAAKTERNSKPQVKNSERGAALDKPGENDKPGEKEKEGSKVRSMFNKTKRFFKKNLPL